MTNHITCDRFADSLAELLDRELPEPARVAMEAHAASCDDCGPLLADLRRLRTEAANLGELSPSRDLWAGIAARIETPVVELNSPNTARPARTAKLERSRWQRRAAIGLAAAALVGITATITHEITKRSVVSALVASRNPDARRPLSGDTSRTSGLNASAVPAATVAATPPRDSASDNTPSAAAGKPGPAEVSLASNRAKPSAQQTYDREISTLRAVLAYRRKDLDSATVAVVDKNLQIIDQAIVQCRQALKKDPQSRFLLESLNDALDNKVQLLRTAATLPSRS